MGTGRGAFLALSIWLAVICEPAASMTPSTGQTEDLFAPRLNRNLVGEGPPRVGTQSLPGTTKPNDVTEAKQTPSHKGRETQEQNDSISIPSEDRDHVRQDSRLVVDDDPLGHSKGTVAYAANTGPHVRISTEKQAPDASDRSGARDVGSSSGGPVNNPTGAGTRRARSAAGDLLHEATSQKEKRARIQTRAAQYPRFSGFKRYTGSFNRHNPKSADYQQQGRYFDLIGGHLLKRSDPLTHKRTLDLIAGNLLKKSFPFPEADKRMIARIAGNLLKQSYPETDKRNFDLIAGHHHIKQPYPHTEKRNIDFIAGNLLKKSHSRIHKRVLDSIADNLLKKSFPGEKNRYADLLARNPLKKYHPEQYRSYIDSIADNLIKKFDPQDGQQFTDSVVGDLLRKSHSRRIKRYIDTIANDFSKKSHAIEDKRLIDPLADNLLKRSDLHEDKRFIDPLADNLLKRSDLQEDKRFIDPLADNLLKRSDPQEDKRFIDPLADNLLKRTDLQEDKRFIDPLADNLLKRSDPQEDKRFIDPLADNLLKRTDLQEDKRFIDPLADNLLKRTDLQEDKRFIDPLADNLLKRSDRQEDKRFIDPLADNLLKRTNLQEDKRFIDPLADNLLKRTNLQEDKRFIDPLADNLLKRSNRQEDKRFIDPLADNLLKRSDLQKDKRFIDPLADNLLKRSDLQKEKRFIDPLADNLLKRSDVQKDKRFIDPLADNLLKRTDLQEGKRFIDPLADNLLKRSDLQKDKRFIDSLADNLLKRSDLQEDKRFIDPLADNLLKRSDLQEDKRFIDPLADNLLKRSDLQKDKRFIDPLADNLLKRSDLQKHKRFIDPLADNLLKRSDLQEDKRFIDPLADNLLKRSNHVSSDEGEVHSGQHSDSMAEDLPPIPDSVAGEVNNDRERDTSRQIASSAVPARLKEDVEDTNRQWPDKRYVYDLLDRETHGLQRDYIDTLAGGLLKRANGREKLWELKDRTETRRRLHSMRNVLVRKVNDVRNYVHVKHFLDWIAGHLLKKRVSHSVRDISAAQHYTFKSGKQHNNEPIPSPNTNVQAQTKADLEMEQPGVHQRPGQMVPVDMSRALHTDIVNTSGGHVLKNRGNRNDELHQSQENVQTGFIDALNEWPKLPEEKENPTRQRRAAPFSDAGGFPNGYGASISDSQTARDERFEGLENRDASAHGGRNRRLQKRFMALPFLLTNLVLHTFPLPSVLKVSHQPGSDVFPEKHGDRNLELFSNDLPEGLSESRLRDSLSGGFPNSQSAKGPTGKEYTDVFPADIFIPDEYMQPSETQLAGSSSSGDVLKWYSGKGSRRKQDSGLSPDEVPEGVFCFFLKYDICFPYSQIKRQGRRIDIDDGDAYDLSKRPVGTGFVESDTSKLSKFPRSTRSETSVTPSMSELLTADADDTGNADKNPGEVYSTTRHTHTPVRHHGQPRKRFWMYKTLLHSLSNNKQTPATTPRVTSHKRFIAPAVWQMLMEKNLYRYNRNFLDSIAGDLLK